ncbi:RING-HC finger protein [archaeon]|nr:MAG: RING-HC finger protein [archaeon]
MASAVYDFPSRCCYCKRQIGPDRHSALQLCGCSIAQCTDCVIASIPSHDKTYTGHFSCPICGIDSPYVFSQGVRGHVASAEDLLLSRAFDFFDIRLPRKSSVTIDKYKFLLSCFDDDFFPAEEQQVVRTAVVDYEGVESIDRLRLLLARLECLRGGPYLSDFEVHGKNPEMQISQYDGLPWGPLGHVEISRNMILDQLLQYETPRLMCDLCFTEEVDIAFYSCSCAQFCCVSCTLRVSKRSAKPFTDGPKCPHCRAISPSTFIDTRAAKKETTDTLANIIARNSKHKRYKETSDKDLKELCVNYYCMLNQEHSDGSYAESLSTYTTEQLQLELVCLSIQQESSLKDLSRELGPLRHISCRTHHFYSVFIKLYKGYKRKLNPSKKPSTEVAPGDDLFEMLSINVLRPGSIDELRRQQIENMKMLSHKFSMMIEDNELDSEDMRQILDGHVAPSDFCAFCCPYCLFQGLSEWSLNKHESIFHTKQSPRPTFFIKQVEKKAPVKETKKNRKQEAPAVAEMPTQMIEEQHGKAKKKAGIPLFCHANKSPQSAPPSNSAPAPVASISPPFPPPVPQKLDLSIFDDDEDEEIFVPYTNCVTLAFAPKENTAGALEDEENVYVLPSRRVVARQEESDSDDMEILVHEKVIGAMGAEEEEASDDEEEGMESDKSIVSMKLNEEGGVRKDEDEEEELYFFDGEEGNDGDIVEVIKSDDQNDFGVASSSHAISSALVSNASICGKKEQMYKYEYANLDDETYAPVKLDKNLLLKVTEKIHKKGPSQSATEQSIGLYPVVQPDMSVIDISNNFTIFNNLDLDGQYEIIFQTYRMHAVKGGTAPAELSGSFSLPFYLEMDRRDSVKCYRHAGINRIARGQSESCLKFKGYIQLFTNTFQLVYAAKALSRQFGFGGEIKKFCNWEGQNLAAAKLTLASLFISPRGDDKVPTSHPMKQYVCIIRPYAPYTRDPDPYPAYVAPALGSSTCAHRHFISHAVQGL